MRISDWSSDVCSSDLRGFTIVWSEIGRPGPLRDRDFEQVRLPQRRSAHHRERRSRNASQYTRVRALSVAPPQNIRPRAAMPGARKTPQQWRWLPSRDRREMKDRRWVRSEDAKRLHRKGAPGRSEEHTSELQSLMRISYAVFCLKKK